MQGIWIWSLVGEPRSYRLCGMAKRKTNPVSHMYTHMDQELVPFWEMGELLDNLELLMATLGKLQFRQVNLKGHPWKKNLTSFRESGKQSLISMQKQKQNGSKNIFSKRILTTYKKKKNFSKKLVTWVGKQLSPAARNTDRIQLFFWVLYYCTWDMAKIFKWKL